MHRLAEVGFTTHKLSFVALCYRRPWPPIAFDGVPGSRPSDRRYFSSYYAACGSFVSPGGNGDYRDNRLVSSTDRLIAC